MAQMILIALLVLIQMVIICDLSEKYGKNIMVLDFIAIIAFCVLYLLITM